MMKLFLSLIALLSTQAADVIPAFQQNSFPQNIQPGSSYIVYASMNGVVYDSGIVTANPFNLGNLYISGSNGSPVPMTGQNLNPGTYTLSGAFPSQLSGTGSFSIANPTLSGLPATLNPGQSATAYVFMGGNLCTSGTVTANAPVQLPGDSIVIGNYGGGWYPYTMSGLPALNPGDQFMRWGFPEVQFHIRNLPNSNVLEFISTNVNTMYHSGMIGIMDSGGNATFEQPLSLTVLTDPFLDAGSQKAFTTFLPKTAYNGKASNFYVRGLSAYPIIYALSGFPESFSGAFTPIPCITNDQFSLNITPQSGIPGTVYPGYFTLTNSVNSNAYPFQLEIQATNPTASVTGPLTVYSNGGQLSGTLSGANFSVTNYDPGFVNWILSGGSLPVLSGAFSGIFGANQPVTLALNNPVTVNSGNYPNVKLYLSGEYANFGSSNGFILQIINVNNPPVEAVR